VLELDGIVGLVVLGLWLYCIYDVITTDESLVRNLPKMVWIFLVIFLFEIGAIVWLIAGRPKGRSWTIGESGGYASRAPRGAEDRPGFDGGPPPVVNGSGMSDIVREREEAARLKVWEAQLKRREEELRRKQLGGAAFPSELDGPTPEAPPA